MERHETAGVEAERIDAEFPRDFEWTIAEKPVDRLTAAVCPAIALFRLLGGHWTVPILYRLQRSGASRPGELERAIPGISRKEMHRRLEELVEAGIVFRRVYPEVPPRVEYGLTARGLELIPAVKHLTQWAERNASASRSVSGTLGAETA